MILRLALTMAALTAGPVYAGPVFGVSFAVAVNSVTGNTQDFHSFDSQGFVTTAERQHASHRRGDNDASSAFSVARCRRTNRQPMDEDRKRQSPIGPRSARTSSSPRGHPPVTA